MGDKQRRRRQFLARHPRCFTCGEPSSEIDHLPSRACFDGRDWPEGFEFPVCRACNNSTAQDEQFLALLSRSYNSPEAPVIDAEIDRYLAGTRNNNPELFLSMWQSIHKADPTFGPDTSLIELGPEVKKCVKRVLPRWGRAFHYLETEEILPLGEDIYGDMFTVDDVQKGRVPAPLLSLKRRPVMRGTKDLSPQFSFSSSVAEDASCCVYVVLFRRAFGAWMAVDKNKISAGPEAEFSKLPKLKLVS